MKKTLFPSHPGLLILLVTLALLYPAPAPAASCSEGGAGGDHLLILSPEELAALNEGAAQSRDADARGVISVRIFFQVQGVGSFQAGPFDTANGHTNAWLKPGSLNLQAHPGPGAKFESWYLNGMFSSSEPVHRVYASRGLTIKAIFTSARSGSGSEDPAGVEPAAAGAPAAPIVPGESRARLCTPEECDGCLSSPACEGAQVGDSCTLFGKQGTCIQIKTCPRLQACCGCQLGGRVYTGDGRVFSPDGRLLSEDAGSELSSGGW